MTYSIIMGKNKKGPTKCAPQSNQHQESLVEEEQPKKKKLRTGTSMDCSDFKDSTARKLIAKAISHAVEDKLTEEERRVFERKLKKERKKEQRTVNLECAIGIKKVEPELLVEEELTAEARRKLRKEREREERKLKKKHPTDLKEAKPEFSLEEKLTAEERIVEKKLKKERKKEEKKSKKECLAKNKEAKSELFLEEELTAEERRVFERKLKKERKKEQQKLKQECPTDLKEAAPQKPSGCELALQYLTSWSQKTEDWKFQKTRQTWLLLHMYDPEKVPGSHFLILLDYLEGLRGSARDLTVRKAEALIKEHENANTEDHTLLELMERARQVIQLLS